ncbi:GspH/FimT family pseudopilin [Lysobacter sp. TY2-98]|uniref:GspH/FimT family pseudopilin n=1 Tax=Lysobacter sp. TY2-98 TaxID=2290922 RepID=UPI0013B395C5|nr:GspH/FimT family pseudopilin [Lysobacter sp. TY2-98]
MRGFSLVELVVTVVVLGVLAAIAVPRFANLIARSRLSGSANEMVALLQTARAEAVSGRASATVCPSANGTACSATIGNRWIAVMTKNSVTTVLRDSTMNSAITIKPSANLLAGANKFTFTPNGFSAAGANASGTVRFCAPNLPGENAIDIGAIVGRISTRRLTSTACDVPAEY